MAMIPSRKGLVDITAKFQQSAKEISSGRLITVQDFRLFDSIGAIEIMDPKMDSGCIPPEEQCDALDMSKVLSVSRAVWIMEEITSLQFCWFRGQSLSQTLLTSYHIDNLLSCERKRFSDILFRPPNKKHHDEKKAAAANYNANTMQEIFRLFCISAVKVVALAMAEIDGSFAPIYDEEDISMQTYGLTLFSKVTADEIMHRMSTCLAIFSASKFTITGLRDEDVRWLTDRFILLARVQVGLLESVNIDNNVPQRIIAWGHTGSLLAALDYGSKKSTLSPTPSAFSHRLQRKYAATQPLKPAVQTDFEEIRIQWGHYIRLILAALAAAPSYAIPEMVNLTKVGDQNQKSRLTSQENIEAFSYSRGVYHSVYAQALAQSRFWNAEGGSIERFIAFDMCQSVWAIDGAFGMSEDRDIGLATPLTLSPFGNVIHAALTKFYRAATEQRGVCQSQR
jgi:hypothetical protein